MFSSVAASSLLFQGKIVQIHFLYKFDKQFPETLIGR